MLSVTSVTASAFHPCLIPQANNLTAEQSAPYRGAFKSRMTEWSYLRSAPTTAAKFWAAQLDAAHAQFIDGRLDLEAYCEQLFEFLERDNAEPDVIAFLSDVAPLIETGRFSPAKGKFSTFLRNRWSAWCARNGVARPVVDEVVVPIVEEVPTAPPVAATAANIDAAYRSYLNREEGAKDKLWALALRFATKRETFLLHGAPAVHDLPDDVAQNVILAALQNISKFKGVNEDGVPCSFYTWFRSICFNRGADALKANIETREERVPMQIVSEDDPSLLEDNPLLYRDEPIQYARALPDFIQGKDKLICAYVREGLTYEQIGCNMEMTEGAVKMRLARMKKQNQNA